MDKDYKNVIVGIQKNIKSKKWNCLFESCKKTSINSHLLQQNGILSTITENGHLIEVRIADIFKWSEKQLPLEFKRVGIKHALSLDVFCNTHDSELFKSVETSPIDFGNIENQTLLSYRVICAEIRKKMINIETYKRLINSNTLNLDSIQERNLKLSILGNEKGIKDLETYKVILEEAIQKKDYTLFEFKYSEYSLIKVYCSAAFTPYETIYTGVEENSLKYVFIHVIPYQNKLHIIVGYHTKHETDYIKNYIHSWDKLTMKELEEKLTNLFATKVENWGLSPKIYQNINKKTLDEFINYFSNNTMNHLQSQEVKFNLFEGENYGV